MRLGVVLFLISTWVGAQDTLTLEQLDYKFVEVENGLTTPLTSLENAAVAGVFLPCHESSLLALCGPNQLNLWVDGRLALTKEKNVSCLYPTIKSLCDLTKRDTIFLSISSTHDLKGVSLRSIELVSQAASDIELRHRGIRDMAWVLGFVASGFAFAGLFLFAPIRLGEILNAKVEYFSERPVTSTTIIHMALVLFFGAFSWTYNSGGGFGEFVKAFTFLFGLLVIRTAIYYLTGNLFQMKKISQWQIVYHVRYWTFFAFLIFLIQMTDNLFLGQMTSDPGILRFIILIAIILYVTVEILILSSFREQKSLHRFIYLCSTEILPSILLIRIFLK